VWVWQLVSQFFSKISTNFSPSRESVCKNNFFFSGAQGVSQYLIA
jgi:hypothetical protein